MSEVDAGARPRKYSRRRAFCLAAVYVLMAIHFAHWWIAGKTVAPLEVSETMHTLEMGVLTAGFFLMAAAILSILVVGRYFCSWGCHILALEDLSAWILRKIGIRPKPVRSRLLLLVPPVSALYMFAWPQVQRLWQGRAHPGFAIWDDGQGWASFVTENYWRSMPGPFVSVLTLLVCGFAIVYFLGSRSFCTYACPYGAIFSVADRFAPGRIVLAGDCDGCGKCTAACGTHIRVHEELIQFGRIVNPSCLKAMDCVDACPTGAVSFGFARPSFFRSFRPLGRFGVPYDFTPAEEVVLLVGFLLGFASFRGLYDAVPFLLSLALSALLAFVVVTALRVTRSANVRLAPFQLALGGRATRAGRAFQAVAALALLLTAHSGCIRYHERAGASGLEPVLAASARGEAFPRKGLDEAIAHLLVCERYGLVRPTGLEERLATGYILAGDAEAAEPHVRRVVAVRPRDGEWRIRLAALHLTKGRVDEAVSELRSVTEGNGADRRTHVRAAAHEMLAQIRMVQGDPSTAGSRRPRSAAGGGEHAR